MLLTVIPNDQTFDQGEGLRSIPFYAESQFFSFDLTAFTDRFPCRLLTRLLEGLIGKEKAEAWYHIMCHYPFEYQPGKTIHYKVGNPMGFYSSWAISTLSHHLVLFVSCLEAKLNFKNGPFKLLGDDIVI